MQLSSQLVLITGAGRGLGRAIAAAFVREGARVIINYRRSQAQAEALAASLGPTHALALQADVTDRAAIDTLIHTAEAHFGQRLSTVVNNALPDFSFNGDARTPFDHLSFEDFDRQFRGSVQGTLNTTKASLPSFETLGSGRIINVGTNLFQHPVVPYHDYIAAKAALLSLTRTLAHDLGPKQITVNMVSGGLLRQTDASSATPEHVFDLIASDTPLRRLTQPEDFADALLFFASPWSRQVTGQNLVVDGGLVKD